ncbi:MAG: hypothetical protein KKB39_00115 [Nanoarchaeota archaeon]|nr:hypothetical protein [Nanoarchaeota archaeon]
MKKLYAVFLLAIFLVSLMPIALAKQGTNEDKPVTANNPVREQVREEVAGKAIGKAQGETVLERQRVRVQNLVESCVSKGATEDRCKGLFEKRLGALDNLPEATQEKLNQFKNNRIEKFNQLKNNKYFSQFDKDKGFKLRTVAKEKLQNARQNFEKAKEKFGLAKEKFQQTKNKFENAKGLQICKDSPDSEECNLAREELTLLAKDKLLDQIGILLENLEQIQAKAEENEALSEEDLQKVLTFVEEKKAQLELIKAEIEAAETKDEIVEAAKNLKQAWNKERVQAHVGFMLNARMAGILVSADHLEAKLERVLERMIENGKDTSVVEPLVADFDSKLVVAKEKFEASQDLFAEARELEAQDRATKVQEAQALLKESKDALREANVILKDIVQELRNANALEELADANETEDIETELEEAE